MRRLGVVLATVGGVGYVPVAPGTVGSAVGAALFVLTRGWGPGVQVALLLAITAVGIWASGEAAHHFEVGDPGHAVIDEVAGQLLTFLLLDLHAAGIAVGFVLFRMLDILKPWPARQFEALPGGWGIMADDLMAGAYAWLILRCLLWLMPAVL